MENVKLLAIIKEIINDNAKANVGILCKRIELLKENKVLSPTLFKALTKEIIYEQSRVLKKLIEFLLIPKVTFITKKEENNE